MIEVSNVDETFKSKRKIGGLNESEIQKKVERLKIQRDIEEQFKAETERLTVKTPFTNSSKPPQSRNKTLFKSATSMGYLRGAEALAKAAPVETPRAVTRNGSTNNMLKRHLLSVHQAKREIVVDKSTGFLTGRHSLKTSHKSIRDRVWAT